MAQRPTARVGEEWALGISRIRRTLFRRGELRPQSDWMLIIKAPDRATTNEEYTAYLVRSSIAILLSIAAD